MTPLTVFLSILERAVTAANPTLGSCSSGAGVPSHEHEKDEVMLDIVFVVLTLLFFIVAAAYISGCERIQ
jgi:hypothetical protein